MTPTVSDQEFEQAREMALGYLNYADRTVSQVKNKLRQKGCSAEVIEAVVTSLEQARLLDDAAFAKRWIEHGLNRRPAGNAKFAEDLRRRGVDGQIIESALAEFADQVGSKEAALGLLSRRLARYTGLERSVAERRMRDLLARRGFDGDTSREAVDETLQAWVNES